MVLLVFSGCEKKAEALAGKPNFTGIIKDIGENSISVLINEDENINQAGTLISVPRKAECKDSANHFAIGDEVQVYYDGTMTTSLYCGTEDSFQITSVDHVYTIRTVNPAM